MYIKIKTDSLSLGTLLEVVCKEKKLKGRYKYSKEDCLCCYCQFSSRGKCALKTCCCILERVQAGACSFVEAMNDCFFNINDHVFQYRLRLAGERFNEKQSCFLSPEHERSFYAVLSSCRQTSEMFIAQLYILTASRELWKKISRYVTPDGVKYRSFPIHDLAPSEYVLFMVAYDFANGTAHLTIDDLSNDEIVFFDSFCVICCAVVVSVYGLAVFKLEGARKKEFNEKGKGKSNGAE